MMSYIRVSVLLGLFAFLSVVQPSAYAQSITITSPTMVSGPLPSSPTITIDFDYFVSTDQRVQATAFDDNDPDTEYTATKPLAGVTSGGQGSITVNVPQPGAGQSIKIWMKLEIVDDKGDVIMDGNGNEAYDL